MYWSTSSNLKCKHLFSFPVYLFSQKCLSGRRTVSFSLHNLFCLSLTHTNVFVCAMPVNYQISSLPKYMFYNTCDAYKYLLTLESYRGNCCYSKCILFILQFGQQLASEQQTDSYDSQAMKQLSYILIPLVIGGAIYSLMYLSYKRFVSM